MASNIKYMEKYSKLMENNELPFNTKTKHSRRFGNILQLEVQNSRRFLKVEDDFENADENLIDNDLAALVEIRKSEKIQLKLKICYQIVNVGYLKPALDVSLD